jgi:hypothetical protein
MRKQMPLFDELERDDCESARYAEPSFSYLNRTARIEFARIRRVLEEWFSHYPTSGQTELRARFRSDIDPQHQAAFFELFLHELIIRLGCQVTLHPAVPDGSRTPDFLAESLNGERFYIEATVATDESAAEAGARARMNAVYDVLDRSIDSSDFFLWLVVKGEPATPPPASRLASFLTDRLAELDPDEVARLYESKGTDAIPRWHFERDRWRIEFRAIPKKPEARDKPGVRPIGMRSTEYRWVDHRTAIRDSIIKKAGRYGELDLPYVVAVNAIKLVDEIDIMEALFGKEQYIVAVSGNGPSEPVQAEMSRLADGAWISQQGPRYTRVSGVLLATRLSPWNIPRAYLCFYHNPWAQKPYQSALTRLPQAVPRDGRMRRVEGESVSAILGLAPSWPE